MSLACRLVPVLALLALGCSPALAGGAFLAWLASPTDAALEAAAAAAGPDELAVVLGRRLVDAPDAFIDAVARRLAARAEAAPDAPETLVERRQLIALLKATLASLKGTLAEVSGEVPPGGDAAASDDLEQADGIPLSPDAEACGGGAVATVGDDFVVAGMVRCADAEPLLRHPMVAWRLLLEDPDDEDRYGRARRVFERCAAARPPVDPAALRGAVERHLDGTAFGHASEGSDEALLRLCMAMGDRARTRLALERAAPDADDAALVAEFAAAHGRALAARGWTEDAERLYDSARRALAATGAVEALQEPATTWLDLAAAARAAGKDAEARSHVAAAAPHLGKGADEQGLVRYGLALVAGGAFEDVRALLPRFGAASPDAPPEGATEITRFTVEDPLARLGLAYRRARGADTMPAFLKAVAAPLRRDMVKVACAAKLTGDDTLDERFRYCIEARWFDQVDALIAQQALVVLRRESYAAVPAFVRRQRQQVAAARAAPPRPDEAEASEVWTALASALVGLGEPETAFAAFANVEYGRDTVDLAALAGALGARPTEDPRARATFEEAVQAAAQWLPDRSSPDGLEPPDEGALESWAGHQAALGGAVAAVARGGNGRLAAELASLAAGVLGEPRRDGWSYPTPHRWLVPYLADAPDDAARQRALAALAADAAHAPDAVSRVDRLGALGSALRAFKLEAAAGPAVREALEQCYRQGLADQSKPRRPAPDEVEAPDEAN